MSAASIIGTLVLVTMSSLREVKSTPVPCAAVSVTPDMGVRCTTSTCGTCSASRLAVVTLRTRSITRWLKLSRIWPALALSPTLASMSNIDCV